MSATQALDAARIARSSVSSLTEKAAVDKAADMSISSVISLHFSAKTFFHSSMNGPLVLSLGRTPTFFWREIRSVEGADGVEDSNSYDSRLQN